MTFINVIRIYKTNRVWMYMCTGILDWTTGTTFDLFAHVHIQHFTYPIASSLFMMGKSESPLRICKFSCTIR